MGNNDPWADAQRLEGYAGEVRVNFIRAAALAVFYCNHLLNYYVFRTDPPITEQFHGRVTAVVLIWMFGVLLLHIFLTRRFVPPALKFLAAGGDLALLTLMLALSGDGPHSPLMLIYFLIIATAPLRLSLPLVYATTVGAAAASMLLLGYQYYFLIGPDNYYNVDPKDSRRIDQTVQIIYLLSLGAAGVLTGQMVRQARRLVEGYTVAVDETREG